jgi:hypothetical protein
VTPELLNVSKIDRVFVSGDVSELLSGLVVGMYRASCGILSQAIENRNSFL